MRKRSFPVSGNFSLRTAEAIFTIAGPLELCFYARLAGCQAPPYQTIPERSGIYCVSVLLQDDPQEQQMPTDTDTVPLNRAARRHQAHIERRPTHHRDNTDVMDAAPAVRRPGRNLLKQRTVLARLGGIRRETLWRWVDAGKFPAPIQLNPDGTLTAWYEDQVDDWINNRPREGGNAPLEAWERRNQLEEERQAENVRNGRTPVRGFKRNAPIPKPTMTRGNRYGVTRTQCEVSR
jgi:predicted DNA-binding transcriptional regulator AlpA